MAKEVHVYTDGGARGNPGPSAIGVVICDSNDKVLCEHKEFLGSGTNNVAEYTALLRALEISLDMQCDTVHCVSDSELMVKQLTGEYRVKAAHLFALYTAVVEIAAKFSKVTYTHARREHPRIVHADRLVNEALDAQ